jgi:hypothetical protein
MTVNVANGGMIVVLLIIHYGSQLAVTYKYPSSPRTLLW